MGTEQASRTWAVVAAVLAVAAPNFGLTAASAADLGGNCCADLEERIAELEATTARKGNRKVSLTLSGWVNEAVFGWDDGAEQNVYVGTNMLEQSRFRFVGEAKIADGWSAGYTIEVGLQGVPSNQWNQFTDNSTSANPTNQDDQLIVRKSYWFLKSKDYGQAAVGQNGTATYHLLDDADLANTRLYADSEAAAVAMAAFLVRVNGQFFNGLKWTDVLRGFNNSTPGQSARRDVVRYDSPTIAGFVLTAAWGQDDLADVALTYKGNIHDFSLLARAGYGNSTDPGTTFSNPGGSFVAGGTPCGGGSITNFDCKWGGAAATVMHNPTGLYLYGGWGRQSLDSLPDTADKNSDTWFIQPGIERKWCPFGKTTLFGEYRHDDPGSNPTKTQSAHINFWAGGVVQNVEPAAMDLYLIYRRADGDFTPWQTSLKEDIDPFGMVIGGALIQF